MYSKELLKGTLPAIILKLLSDEGKMYGYQITRRVLELSDNKIMIKEGSLYPALHKLKANGLLDIETVHIGKRVRRYYSLTTKGIEAHVARQAEMIDYIGTLNKLFT